jgi:hypothetical protein
VAIRRTIPDQWDMEMTEEDEFRDELLRRIVEAIDKTGHTFFGLLTAIKEEGAVETARRLIGPNNNETFQDGMRQLKDADLLHLTVEQAVIDFGEQGKIFTSEEIAAAKERLQLVLIVL